MVEPRVRLTNAVDVDAHTHAEDRHYCTEGRHVVGLKHPEWQVNVHGEGEGAKEQDEAEDASQKGRGQRAHASELTAIGREHVLAARDGATRNVQPPAKRETWMLGGAHLDAIVPATLTDPSLCHNGLLAPPLRVVLVARHEDFIQRLHQNVEPRRHHAKLLRLQKPADPIVLADVPLGARVNPRQHVLRPTSQRRQQRRATVRAAHKPRRHHQNHKRRPPRRMVHGLLQWVRILEPVHVQPHGRAGAAEHRREGPRHALAVRVFVPDQKVVSSHKCQLLESLKHAGTQDGATPALEQHLKFGGE